MRLTSGYDPSSVSEICHERIRAIQRLALSLRFRPGGLFFGSFFGGYLAGGHVSGSNVKEGFAEFDTRAGLGILVRLHSLSHPFTSNSRASGDQFMDRS